jgi:hypothetical protein
VADNPVWPDTLPQTPFFADAGPEYTPMDNTISTSVTVGPVKRRRRFTAVPETLKIQLWLTSDQLATLKDFVQNQLQDVLPFDWLDWRSNDQCSYRCPKGWGSFTQKHDSGDVWIVQAELERMP